ncbi:MAG: PaaI family thioesterase [Actinomycetota bacterium]
MSAIDGADLPDTTDPAYGDFPLKRYLGMELAGDEPGRASAELTLGAEHLNPNGVVHGAVLFALVDTAMGKATMSVIDEPDRFCASVEVSLRFIRPATEGAIVATADVVKRGRHIAHLQADVTGADDRLVATATGTFAIIGG